MKISMKWLARYVDVAVSPKQLCDIMTMRGFEVEGVEDLSASMTNVVVGRIEKIEKHPDSDHLQICQINTGDAELIQIITGAQNVFEGAYVPAALHDSHLPCGVHIKRGKLRGLPSNGMLCSGEELCLTEADYPGAEVNGIMILQGEPKPGTDLRELLALDDVIIDFSVTSNRPDCQSVLGMAREIACALNTAFRAPVPTYKTVGGDAHDHIQVTVHDFDLCPRYMGRVVRNLRIAPSPDWMKQALKAAGMRPINNIVDITNFVMLETGQPMHAFDLGDVRGAQIHVRRARAGETITTLDEKPHDLTDEMLVIADGEAPSCIAGIMGGAESEIEADTADLFLEAAKFRRDSVRRTARALGMRTESSSRFERGLDIMGVEYAMNRALQLIDELDAGDILDGVIDCNEGLPAPRTVTVSAQAVCDLLGVDIPAATQADILCRLQIPTVLDGDLLTCTVPSFRDDIENRADIAEEVMRIYGYEHMHGTPIRGTLSRGTRTPERLKKDKIKHLLTARGLREVTTYSFISARAADALRLAADDERRGGIVIANPLGEDYAVMRTQLVTSMLNVLLTNQSRKIPAARFFEVGKRYHAAFLPIDSQPDELPVLAIGLYGEADDFFTLKGLVEDVFDLFGQTADCTRAAEPFLHPGRQAAVAVGGEVAAVFGEVHPQVAEAFGLNARTYVAEIQLAPLFAAVQKPLVCRPLPKYPAVERDLALLADEDLPVGEMEKAIRAGGGKLLESVRLFDVYRGAQIPAGKKSVAYNVVFRSADGTLSDAELEPVLQKIYKKLQEKGCILRME